MVANANNTNTWKLAKSTCHRHIKIENVIFSAGHTDTDIIRLSSVWPTDFEYHSQAPATAVRVKMAADFTAGHGFRPFIEAESSVLEFTVIDPYRTSK